MTFFRREMFQVPRDISRKVYARFGAEMFARFILMIDDYQAYWDEFRTGDGFPAQDYPVEILGYFDAVSGRIDASCERYFEKAEGYAEFCDKQSSRAKTGVKKKVKKKAKAEYDKARYVDKKDEINRKRRENYEWTKAKKQKNLDFRRVNDCPQTETGKKPAKNSAKDTGSITTLRSVILDTGKGVQGENQVIHSEVEKSNPSGSLRGSNRPAGGSNPPGGGEAGSKGSGKKAAGLPEAGSWKSDPSGSNRPAGALGKDGLCAEPGEDYDNPQVRIVEGWTLNLKDYHFQPYARMRSKFKKNFESWINDEFPGRLLDKNFICRQIQRSAVKTKELAYMLGIAPDSG